MSCQTLNVKRIPELIYIYFTEGLPALLEKYNLENLYPAFKVAFPEDGFMFHNLEDITDDELKEHGLDFSHIALFRKNKVKECKNLFNMKIFHQVPSPLYYYYW